MNVAPSFIRFSKFSLLSLGCLFSCLYAGIAAATLLTLNINDADRIAPAGSSQIFAGTITNNTGADVFASDLFLDFSGYDPTVVSLAQLLGSPDFVIPDGNTSPQVDLFSLNLDPSILPGTYFADVLVQDGNDPPDLSNVVTVSVTIPEPDTAAMLGLGLLPLLFYRGRMRSEQSL